MTKRRQDRVARYCRSVSRKLRIVGVGTSNPGCSFTDQEILILRDIRTRSYANSFVVTVAMYVFCMTLLFSIYGLFKNGPQMTPWETWMYATGMAIVLVSVVIMKLHSSRKESNAAFEGAAVIMERRLATKEQQASVATSQLKAKTKSTMVVCGGKVGRSISWSLNISKSK